MNGDKYLDRACKNEDGKDNISSVCFGSEFIDVSNDGFKTIFSKEHIKKNKNDCILDKKFNK